MTTRERASTMAGTRRFAGTLLVAALATGGCTDFAGYDLDYIMGRASVLSTMRNTVSFEAQDIALMPPVGTVPVISPSGNSPAAFTQLELDAAAATLTNPLESSEAVLARGALVYNNQCAVCHGAQGQGNGVVVGVGKFPTAPTLVGGTAPGRSDGYIYAVIRVGRGLMPSYGERIGHEDRWAVVHYVRQLQGGQVTPPTLAPPAAAPAAAPDTGAPAAAEPATAPPAAPATNP